MDEKQFEKVLLIIKEGLSGEQLVRLEAQVRQAIAAGRVEAEMTRRAVAIADARRCPHCGNGHIAKHGRDDLGRQRFRCVARQRDHCGATFNVLSHTPLARMKKADKWLGYVAQMAEHRSCAKIAESGLGISKTTAWRWRHRFLALPSVLMPKALDGVIEADETFFRSSYKGSRAWRKGQRPEPRSPRYRGGPAIKPGRSKEQIAVLTALDRSRGAIEAVIPNLTQVAVCDALAGRIAQGSVLCSDGYGAYPKAAVASESEHRRILPPKKDWLTKAKGQKPRQKGRLGLGRVNGHHQRLDTMFNREARGVATKYLPAYLGWHRFVALSGRSPEEMIGIAISGAICH